MRSKDCSFGARYSVLVRGHAVSLGRLNPEECRRPRKEGCSRYSQDVRLTVLIKIRMKRQPPDPGKRKNEENPTWVQGSFSTSRRTAAPPAETPQAALWPVELGQSVDPSAWVPYLLARGSQDTIISDGQCSEFKME